MISEDQIIFRTIVTRSKRRLIGLAGMAANSVVNIERNGQLDKLVIMRPRPVPSRPMSAILWATHQHDDENNAGDDNNHQPDNPIFATPLRPISPRSILKKPKSSPFTLFGRKRAMSLPPTSSTDDKENETTTTNADESDESNNFGPKENPNAENDREKSVE